MTFIERSEAAIAEAKRAKLPPPIVPLSRWQRMVADVCIGSCVKPLDVLSPIRGGHAVQRKRQEVMWRLRQPPFGLCLPAIGRLVGRDHTTALNGIRKHAARIEREAA